jgi:hypothetical protein
VGTTFGVEKTTMSSTKKKRELVTKESLGDGGPTRATPDQSNRELRRLFVKMFQPVGGDRIVVAFVEDTLADAAKQQWKGDPESSCRIMITGNSYGHQWKETMELYHTFAVHAQQVGYTNSMVGKYLTQYHHTENTNSVNADATVFTRIGLAWSSFLDITIIPWWKGTPVWTSQEFIDMMANIPTIIYHWSCNHILVNR